MFIIFIGVSGCGKTTFGKKTANVLGIPFYEGDEYHSLENVEKMARGIPLTDEDRKGWLETLSQLIHNKLGVGESGVLSCSALKQKYRDKLKNDSKKVLFIYLKGSYGLIQSRLQARTGHYMPSNLLKSQFEILEEPEDVFTVDIDQTPNEVLDDVLAILKSEGITTG